jgi:hypothetical protein
LRKTGKLQKNNGNKPKRNPNNRQENSSSRRSNQNPKSASANSASGNAGSKKKSIHPWVSSSPTSSQALTSHILMANNNQSGGNSNNRNKPQGQKRRNPSRQQRENGSNGGPRSRNHIERKQNGNRNSSNANVSAEDASIRSGSDKELVGSLDAFSLFCAYHLGIGPNKEYKPSNINEVARRFGQDQGVVKQALKECNMDSASLLNKDFDMALAQLDIQVAPEGIDKMELAKSIYEEFLQAPNIKRDWKKIIEEDRKENRKIFG